MTITVDATCIGVFKIVAGLDFVWCGYLFLTTSDIARLPRLLGYWMFKLCERAASQDKGSNDWVTEIGRAMFSLKAASVYSLLGGLALIVNGVFDMLLQILFPK